MSILSPRRRNLSLYCKATTLHSATLTRMHTQRTSHGLDPRHTPCITHRTPHASAYPCFKHVLVPRMHADGCTWSTQAFRGHDGSVRAVSCPRGQPCECTRPYYLPSVATPRAGVCADDAAPIDFCAHTCPRMEVLPTCLLLMCCCAVLHAAVFASAGRDGKVLLWDTRNSVSRGADGGKKTFLVEIYPSLYPPPRGLSATHTIAASSSPNPKLVFNEA